MRTGGTGGEDRGCTASFVSRGFSARRVDGARRTDVDTGRAELLDHLGRVGLRACGERESASRGQQGGLGVAGVSPRHDERERRTDGRDDRGLRVHQECQQGRFLTFVAGEAGGHSPRADGRAPIAVTAPRECVARRQGQIRRDRKSP